MLGQRRVGLSSNVMRHGDDVLNPKNVPPELRHLISLAEKFGLADDLARERLVKSVTQEERNALIEAIRVHDDAFDNWLAGPEAKGPEYSEEYIAFSAMRMAADYA